MTEVKQTAVQDVAQMAKDGKAVSGIRALRNRLAAESPGFALAIDVERQSERFCQEVRDGLRGQRKKMGLDQVAVAKRLDMTQSAVSKIEAGEGDIGLKTVFRYAQSLGLRPVCVFIPTGDQLFSDTPGEQVQMSETARAAEDFQIGLVRDTCDSVSSAMVSFARTFK